MASGGISPEATPRQPPFRISHGMAVFISKSRESAAFRQLPVPLSQGWPYGLPPW